MEGSDEQPFEPLMEQLPSVHSVSFNILHIDASLAGA